MPPIDAITRRFQPLHPRLVDLSLGRIERLLAEMGNPERRLPPVIHVAGTNGKGSTVAFMRAILEAAGRRVHVYTSPHLVRFNERVRLAGELVDDARLGEALDHAEQVNAGQSISVFEITTAAAFWLYSRTPADVLLLEVGLGGRFDATNVIADPAVTVVTPVSIDHIEFLGGTIEKIAYEKAGVFKPGAWAVIAEQDAAAAPVLEREAIRVGARRRFEGRDYFMRGENGRLVYEDEHGLIDLPKPRLPGRHQYGNAAAAIAALRLFAPDLSGAAFERGLQEAQWPARLQRLRVGPLVARAPAGAEVWLDGAHNEAGGRVVAEAMADFEEAASRSLVLICGTLASKDTRGFLAHFKGLAREVLAVPVPGEHAGRSADEVAGFAHGVGLNARVAASVGDALDLLAQENWPKPPRILIVGSLYLAGAVLQENGALPD